MKPNPTRDTIPGIHHITAITNSANVNLDFYTRVLGMRLVKKTVNFDDPYTYHLYYGDESGTPGTILTFFPWENMSRGKPGAGQVTGIAFAIPTRSVVFWANRLQEFSLQFSRETRFGETLIRFTDPQGLALELVATNRLPDIKVWEKSPIPQEHCIRGFHSATATLKAITATADLLTDVMGMRRIAADNNRHRFQMHDGDGPGAYYDIIEDPHARGERMGSGTVHHIAFRTANAADQKRWQKAIEAHGLNVTPMIDRKYFRSIYFRESGGVLFEIATDSPGFLTDEDITTLGEHLMLPQHYETRRAEIERHLPKLYPVAGRTKIRQAV